MLLVSFATARVFVLDLNSALCGSNWKRHPLVVDGNDMKTVNQQFCWTRRLYHFAGYEEERLHFEVSVRFHPGDYGLCIPARGSGTMTTGVTPAFSQGTASKRSVPRYKLTVPLALTVLRSGMPNNIPGRTSR